MTNTISSRELGKSANWETQGCQEVENSSNGARLSHQLIESSLQVVHATSGRIRLRATDISLKTISLKTALETFSQKLRQQDGVTEVCLNQQTGSVVVTFDEKKLSFSQMLALLQQLGVSQPPASSEDNKTDPFAAWKSVEFWKEQGLDFIPLITGLLVTGRLGIHGLASVPVYMLTAGATRQVIDLTRGEKQGEQGSRGAEEQGSRGEFHLPPTTYHLPFSDSFDYKVVHAIPGRVRFHVPRSQDRAYAQRLERLLKADAQVTSFRVNREAASVAINYEPSVIPISHWVELLHSAEESSSLKTSNAQASAESPMATNQRSLSKKDIQPLALDSAAITSLPEEESDSSLPLESIAIIQQPTPLELTSFWAEMKPPALSLSLAFMANLPIQAVPE